MHDLTNERNLSIERCQQLSQMLIDATENEQTTKKGYINQLIDNKFYCGCL